jgi:hypothetical protein
MSEITLAELDKALDNLILESRILPLEETDITIGKMQAKLNSGSVRAKRLLDELTAAGKLEYLGERMDEGHKVRAWQIRKQE